MRFDYIVVGGGTSGCVIASELAQKGFSVCIIEKGKKSFWRHLVNLFPNGTFFSLRSSFFTKNYVCESSKNLNYRKLIWPRGEILGGCSAINGLVYKRAVEKDFEYLINNDDKLSWNSIIREYVDIEKKLKIYKNSSYQSERHLDNNISKLFLKTLENLKFKLLKSFNDDHDFSKNIASLYDLSINNKLRSYAVSFLKYKNITILDSSICTKINFKNNIAESVNILQSKKKIKVYVDKEVIISAGVINSPKILQLSGIGEQEHLNSLGIKCIYQNEWVGKNLRDHLQTKLTYEIKLNNNFNYVLKNKLKLFKELFKYIFLKKSFLNEGAIKAGAFCYLGELKKNKYDFQINLLLGSGRDFNTVDHFNGISISVNTLSPSSNGYIKIKSKNIFDDPVISPNYFTKDSDIIKHIEGIKLIRRLVTTAPFNKIILREVLPGKNQNSEESLREFIKNFSETIYHGTGSCKMGQKYESVVDHDFKVYGFSNLRVCDASVMPNSTNGNPAATCYVLSKILSKKIT